MPVASFAFGVFTNKPKTFPFLIFRFKRCEEQKKEISAPDPREYPFFLHFTVLYLTEKKIPREGGVEMVPKVEMLPAQKKQ